MRYSFLALFLISIFTVSCKKVNPSPDDHHSVVPPKDTVKGNTVDTSLLVGWWRWRDSLTNYRAQYFGPDGFYVRDTGVPEVGYFTVPNWWWGKNDTLFLGVRSANVAHPGGFVVKKLTKDSLVTTENTFFRVTLPYFTSPAVKIIAGARSPANDFNGVNNVPLGGPGCVATDLAGNIYICDGYSLQSQLYKIAADNKSAISLSGAFYDNNLIIGDSIPAKQVYLEHCSSMALDAAGNIYLNMDQLQTIRKISAIDGKIYTIYKQAQIGMQANSIALNAAGDIYMSSNQGPGLIKKISAKGGSSSLIASSKSIEYGGDGGPVANAGFTTGAIALDKAGNLYITDNHNNRIRKIDKNGIISTIAGNGTSGFSGDGGPAISAKISRPTCITVANNGDVYFCDGGVIRDAGRVRKISAATGIITSIGGNGFGGIYYDMAHATAATMNPSGLAVDQLGNVYVSDGDINNQSLLKISAK